MKTPLDFKRFIDTLSGPNQKLDFEIMTKMFGCPPDRVPPVSQSLEAALSLFLRFEGVKIRGYELRRKLDRKDVGFEIQIGRRGWFSMSATAPLAAISTVCVFAHINNSLIILPWSVPSPPHVW